MSSGPRPGARPDIIRSDNKPFQCSDAVNLIVNPLVLPARLSGAAAGNFARRRRPTRPDTPADLTRPAPRKYCRGGPGSCRPPKKPNRSESRLLCRSSKKRRRDQSFQVASLHSFRAWKAAPITPSLGLMMALERMVHRCLLLVGTDDILIGRPKGQAYWARRDHD